MQKKLDFVKKNSAGKIIFWRVFKGSLTATLNSLYSPEFQGPFWGVDGWVETCLIKTCVPQLKNLNKKKPHCPLH